MAKINIHIRLNTSSPVSNYLTGMDRIDRIKNGRGSHPGGPLAFNRDGQDEQDKKRQFHHEVHEGNEDNTLSQCILCGRPA